MLAYLAYMAERLALLRMMLKETGSIYLHCDPHASHYLKMVMDDIFGAENFRNQIVWKRTTSDQKGSHHASKSWGNNTDIIFFYVKSNENKLNPFRPLTEQEIAAKFNKTDEKGRKYQDDSAHIFCNKIHRAAPSLCYEWKGFYPPHPSGWRLSKGRLEEEYQKGNIVIREDGKLERRRYLEDHPGIQPGNLWTDIPPASGKEKKYPTQKPLKLLKRIIKASTNEGDVVLDPFCGCGTTVVAAKMLKRKFVGIDISLYAVETVTYEWLRDIGMAKEEIQIKGIPEDLQQAKRFAKEDPFGFETFAVEACHPGMIANKDQRKDGGVDGKGKLLHSLKNGQSIVLAQVKSGGFNIDHVKAFAHNIRSMKGAVAGVFITLEKDDWTDDMRRVEYEMGTFKYSDSVIEYPRLQHWHIGQFYYKTLSKRLPNLPDLKDPGSGKKMEPRQTGFLSRQYEI